MSGNKRLIDANALFDDLLKKQHSEQSMGIAYSFYPQMRAIVVKQPTVDAVEMVHGDWIDGRPYVNSRWKVCSVCHQTAPEPHGGYNYCPNCGAKMDGERKADAQ